MITARRFERGQRVRIASHAALLDRRGQEGHITHVTHDAAARYPYQVYFGQHVTNSDLFRESELTAVAETEATE